MMEMAHVSLESRSEMTSATPGSCANQQLLRKSYKWIANIRGGPKRVNHAAVLIGDLIYVFGGFCTGGNYILTEPIDVLTFNTITLRWNALPVPKEYTKEMPFMRYGHAVIAYGHYVYLFGGRNDKGACNNLYRFDTRDNRWELVRTSGAPPGSRDGHTVCRIGHTLYVFGGFEENENCFSNDIFALDLRNNVWSYIGYRGTPPSHRDFHSACAIGTRMYIFGGRSDMSGPYHSEKDIYCNRLAYFDTVTQEWHYPGQTGDVPSGRRSHSAFVYKGDMYIFGGYESNQKIHYNDMFRYCVQEERWEQVPINVDRTGPPRARRRHVSIIAGDRLFISGGTSPMIAEEKHFLGLDDQYAENQGEMLTDHDDLYILDFNPTLKTLCLSKVIEYNLNPRSLPQSLQGELHRLVADQRLNTSPGSFSSASG